MFHAYVFEQGPVIRANKAFMIIPVLHQHRETQFRTVALMIDSRHAI